MSWLKQARFKSVPLAATSSGVSLMVATKLCVVAWDGKDRETDLDEVHAGLKTDFLNRVELIFGLSSDAAIKAGAHSLN
jgi:hypothetical protein